MAKTLMTAALIATGLLMAACNTVRGAAKDLNSAANATSNAINH